MKTSAVCVALVLGLAVSGYAQPEKPPLNVLRISAEFAAAELIWLPAVAVALSCWDGREGICSPAFLYTCVALGSGTGAYLAGSIGPETGSWLAAALGSAVGLGLGVLLDSFVLSTEPVLAITLSAAGAVIGMNASRRYD